MSYPVDGDKIPEAREGELYSLKWHTFQSHLTSGLKTFLFEPEFLTDVTLVAEGKSIRSHRMLLSLCSPHFRQLFQGNSGPNTNTIVILNNVRYQDLQHVVQFIYNGEVKVSNNHELQGFLQTGELLQIEGLTKTGSTNNETEGQPPQPHGRTSPLAQSTPLPPTGGHRRSHHLVPNKQSRQGSHHQVNANVPSANSIMGEHTGHIPPATKRPRIAPSATVTSANYDNTESSIIAPDLNQSGEEMVDPLGSIPGGDGMAMDPLMEMPETGQLEEEEEQMITIKSEGGVEAIYGDRGEEEEEEFDMTEHGDASGMGEDEKYGYVGGGGESLGDMSLAGPSSAIASGASGSTSAHKTTEDKKDSDSKTKFCNSIVGKKRPSFVHKYFREDEERNFCLHCPVSYKKQPSGTTSAMKRHITRCHSQLINE